MLLHTDRRPPVKAVGTIFTIAMLPLRAKKFEEHKTSANPALTLGFMTPNEGPAAAQWLLRLAPFNLRSEIN
jgi:hypothetical protein